MNRPPRLVSWPLRADVIITAKVRYPGRCVRAIHNQTYGFQAKTNGFIKQSCLAEKRTRLSTEPTLCHVFVLIEPMLSHVDKSQADDGAERRRGDFDFFDLDTIYRTNAKCG